MSGAQLVEDLRASGLALLSDVTSIIMADMNATDLAIVRIESLIEAISSVNSYVEFSWSQNATQLLLKIIQELEHVADSVEHRSEVGRPKIHIPIHAIENLMELNFNVPRIASMLGVSRDTIFRRMKENGLSVSHMAPCVPTSTDH
jgi:DNA-binding NtrC family response regulator